MPAPSARDRTPLSRERIVRAALRLIDERGLAACTMRALGAELGVEAMSLYRHVRGKEDLWDGVVDLLQEGLAGEAPDPGGWRGGLRGFALRFRAVAREHPHAFPLVARRPATGYLAARGLAEGGLRTLVEAGFSSAEAAAALRAVSRWVIGFALAESAAAPGAPPLPARPRRRPARTIRCSPACWRPWPPSPRTSSSCSGSTCCSTAWRLAWVKRPAAPARRGRRASPRRGGRRARRRRA